MEVICAKTAGFCFGVRRAVDTVYEQIEKQEKPVYTNMARIIHNEQVVEDLEKKGVRVAGNTGRTGRNLFRCGGDPFPRGLPGNLRKD